MRAAHRMIFGPTKNPQRTRIHSEGRALSEQSASTHVLPLDEINSLWKRKSEELSEADAMTAPRYASLGYLAYFASAYHTPREHQRRVYLTKRSTTSGVSQFVSSSFIHFLSSVIIISSRPKFGKKPLMNDSPIKSRIRAIRKTKKSISEDALRLRISEIFL